MTVIVNSRDEREEKVLLAFLDSLQYEYQTDNTGISLTDDEEKEILRREQAFAEGKTSARSWDEIRKDLENVYR